jgi:hypothetical protein
MTSKRRLGQDNDGEIELSQLLTLDGVPVSGPEVSSKSYNDSPI